MKDLVEEGFYLAANWVQSTGKLEISPVDKSLCHTKRVIIAFLLNERVMYIGRSTRSLQEFAVGIRNASGSQITNLRLNPSIAEAISEGQNVSIWIKVLPEADRANLDTEKKRLNGYFSPAWKA